MVNLVGNFCVFAVYNLCEDDISSYHAGILSDDSRLLFCFVASGPPLVIIVLTGKKCADPLDLRRSILAHFPRPVSLIPPSRPGKVGFDRSVSEDWCERTTPYMSIR